MQPVPEWRRVLRHAWSVRLIILAALLDGLSAALAIDPYLLPVPLAAVSITAGLVNAAAFVSRLVAQKEVPS